jgi:hypothetical protein
MNNHDRDNLKFLLYSSESTLRDWHDQADPDDLAYAHELLAIAAAELRDGAIALRVEAELALNPDYADARVILDKIAKR